MLRWMWLVFLIYFKQFFGCFMNYICYKERYITKLRFFVRERLEITDERFGTVFLTVVQLQKS